jgi:tetratricopeptide (TPR) repeat protein
MTTQNVAIYHHGYIDPEEVKRKHDRTVAILRAWAEKEPEEEHYPHYLSRMYMSAGNAQEAYRWGVKSVEIMDKKKEKLTKEDWIGRVCVFFFITECCKVLGKFDEIEGWYNRGFEIYPDYHDLYASRMGYDSLRWLIAAQDRAGKQQYSTVPFATQKVGHLMHVVQEFI